MTIARIKRIGSFIYKHCFHDCCQFRRKPHLKDQPMDICGLFHFISVKFLLEVCGAAGAVWGSSEATALRHTANTESWRWAAMFVGVVFGVRFWWHAKHYFQHQRDFLPIKLHHRRTWRLPFVQIFSSKFLLDVCGGTGAIWGCSEALALRKDSNQEEWRIVAVGVGAVFGIRWVFQALAYCLYLAPLWSNPSSILMKAVRCYEVLVSMVILEMFGAVGAVWGFSQVIWLRTPQTLALWRTIALSTGVVFTGRWWFHVYAFIRDERNSVHTNNVVQPQDTETEEVQDLEISDLELKEEAT